MKRLFLAIAAILFLTNALAVAAFAATYYISPSGNDTIGSGTNGSPWATLSKAFSSMLGGDALIIKDGTYNQQLANPPTGTSGNYTKIQAENNFKVNINYSGPALRISARSYIRIEGLKFNGNGSGGDTADIVGSSYIKLIRCSFSGAKNSDNISCVAITSGSSYVLLEECWSWGTGRYKFLVYQSNHVIVRRCVARHDYHTGSWNTQCAPFVRYESPNTEFQNCISIDSSSSPTDGTVYAGIWNENNGGIDTSGKDLGCIILNVGSNGLGDFKVKGTRTIENCAIVGGNQGISTGSFSNLNGTIYMRHITILGMATNGVWVEDYPTVDNMAVCLMTDSIITQCGSVGLDNILSSTYNDLYANGANYRKLSGTNDITSDPALKYICRVETGSPSKGTASDGGDRGATIIKRYGLAETLWGESGYETLTSVNLWPFPNEVEIRNDMRSYSGLGPSGNRGFCVDGQTLTKYIWEYLGNTIPAEIYGGVSDITAPAAVSNLAATTGSSSGQINLNWTAPGDDGSAGTATTYIIKYAASAITNDPQFNAATTVTGAPVPATAGTAQNKTVSGLTPGNTYYFAIKTQDEVPNTSRLSNSSSAVAYTAAPAAPTGLSAAAGIGQVSLSWNSVSGVSGYKVKYGTTSGTYPTVIDVGNVTGKVVTGLTNGTIYYFVTTAYNSGGESGNSAQVSTSPVGLTTGLVGRWQFNETSGTTAANAVSGGSSGTLINGPTWGNSALSFDGNNDYVEVANQSSLENVQEGDYTLSVWFKPNSVPPGTGAAGNALYALVIKTGWHLGLVYNNDGTFAMFHWLTGNVGVGSGGNVHAPGTFYHVVGIVSKTNGTVKIYVNGILEDTATFTAGTAAKEYGTMPWRIGAGNPSTTADYAWPANGVIDDARIYSRALSDTEVVSLYQGGSGQSDSTAPAAVSNLAATTGSSSGQINLNWTAPGDDGSAGTATTYIIKYAASAITNDPQFNAATTVTGAPVPATAGTAQNKTVSGLTPGNTYYFAIKTQDEVPNTSRLSNSPNAIAYTAAPAAPTGLSAAAGIGQVSLSWSAVSGATGYKVKYSTATGVYSTVKTGISSPNTTITSLTNGITYYFIATATNAGGESGNSAQVSASPVGLTTGLVGRWQFNETSGTTAANAVSGGSSGTLINGPTWGNSALSFDGNNDYVEVANQSSLENVQEGDYTLSVWFKPNSLPSGTIPAWNSAYGLVIKTGYHEGLVYRADGSFEFSHWFTGDAGISGWSGNVHAPGTFYHVVGIVSKTNGTVKIYVNGILEDTATFAAGTAAKEYGTMPWRIGAGNPNTTADYAWPANGVIDDARIYSRSLSDTEVSSLYNENSGNPPQLTSAAESANASFDQGEIYIYPNPAKNGKTSIIHAEVGIADSVEINIYDVAGELVDSAKITDLPIIIDQKYAYEYQWDVANKVSGIYICRIIAIKGEDTIKATKKFAVVK